MDLRTYLFINNIKQVDICKSLNIDPSRLSNYINQVRPIPDFHAAKIANFLNVSIKEILSNNIETDI